MIADLSGWLVLLCRSRLVCYAILPTVHIPLQYIYTVLVQRPRSVVTLYTPKYEVS